MSYLLSFLEGITTFISPCLLPMLPLYVSYFAGQNEEVRSGRALSNALGFVLGFTLIFTLLGAFAGTLGTLLNEYKTVFNLISGLIVILFGLNFIGIIKVPFINRNRHLNYQFSNLGFCSSVLFGIIFSIGWTPCVGAFLGSALMLAAQSGESMKGILMLLSYSLGLGIPFVVSAVLIEQLKSTFDFIKRNYKIINLISGTLLILLGLLMATGTMGFFLSLLTF
ncbi:cytochrome c biogenesis CcdA family protein [Clostridium aminobutyricum]|uniref:Sulfite exporter TauE/SafE family protein n=1 Tax=Clostridium aminobutyricum TaxID=33953 RepID=A0A939D8V7_CLOAM|nr:cytochrome c biogenesis protein CcdA [Clostridium aminobutyricum]MBN7773265.1 sulfite exporter TauE/SafE family protein [Clostridium aminobutyricum]